MVNNTETLNRTFAALADPVRRSMLQRLRAGAATVGELGASHKMSLPGTLKHVRYLESAGLILARKEGRTRICTLAPAPLAAAASWLEHYRQFWTERLDVLEQYLDHPAAGGTVAWKPPPTRSSSKSAVPSPPHRSASSTRGPKQKR